jgi:hypothetical protein
VRRSRGTASASPEGDCAGGRRCTIETLKNEAPAQRTPLGAATEEQPS